MARMRMTSPSIFDSWIPVVFAAGCPAEQNGFWSLSIRMYAAPVFVWQRYPGQGRSDVTCDHAIGANRIAPAKV